MKFEPGQEVIGRMTGGFTERLTIYRWYSVCNASDLSEYQLIDSDGNYRYIREDNLKPVPPLQLLAEQSE